MFSKTQLEKMAPKRQATQEMFDAAVRENMETFDMELEEALEGAIKDMRLQGYSLDLVATSGLGGRQGSSDHPSLAALEGVRLALDMLGEVGEDEGAVTGEAASEVGAVARHAELVAALRALRESLLADNDGEDGCEAEAGSEGERDAERVREGKENAEAAGGAPALPGPAKGIAAPGGGLGGGRAHATAARAKPCRDALAMLAGKGAAAELVRGARIVSALPRGTGAWLLSAAALGSASVALLSARHHREDFATAGGVPALLALLIEGEEATGDGTARGGQVEPLFLCPPPSGGSVGRTELPPLAGLFVDQAVAVEARLGRDASGIEPSAIHVAPLLEALSISAVGFEPSKVALVAAGAPSVAVSILARGAEVDEAAGPRAAASKAAVIAACRLLVASTTADDETLPSSAAFAHARGIGKAHLRDLVPVLAAWARASPGGPQTAALCDALRRLLATEELCASAVEGGLIEVSRALLRGEPRAPATAASPGPSPVPEAPPAPRPLRSHAALARALTASDAGKRRLVAEGGLEDLATFLARLRVARKAALEEGPSGRDGARAGPTAPRELAAATAAALGAVAGAFLRYPEAADRAAEGGTGSLFDQVLACIRDELEEGRAGLAARERDGDPAEAAPLPDVPAAVRVGATALRNAAARSATARQLLLEKGAEPLLRATLAGMPPGDTRDAVAGAVRDLGLDP